MSRNSLKRDVLRQKTIDKSEDFKIITRYMCDVHIGFNTLIMFGYIKYMFYRCKVLTNIILLFTFL